MIDRRVSVGTDNEVTFAFFEDGSLVVPSDPALYPNYVVRDPTGNFITGGVATINPSDNLYHATITIPQDAVISTETAKYAIECEILSTLGKEYKSLEYFDVVNPIFDLSDLKEQQKLVLSFTPLVLSLPLPQVPTSIKLKIYDPEEVVVFEGTPTSSGTYPDYYIYSITVAADTLTSNKDYAGVWTFTIAGEESIFYQKVHCGNLVYMSYISDLRMRADKVGKSIDTYIGYHDSTLYFHLHYGLGILNMLRIPTNWTYLSFTGSMGLPVHSWLECSLLSLLRAQYLAEGDSAFDYSGQPVSLSVDRTGFIESEIGRIESGIESMIIPWKVQVIRRAQNFQAGFTYPTVGGFTGYGIDQRYSGVPMNQVMTFRR